MKITFVIPEASLAGGIRVVAIYAEQLRRRGHEVLVISTPRPRPTLRDRLRHAIKGVPLSSPPGASHLDGLPVEHRVLDRFRPVRDGDVPDADVVVATFWTTAQGVANLSPAKGAKVYFIQHYEVWAGSVDKVDATYRLPLHPVVISQWLRDLMRDKFRHKSISLVPNSVDMEQFHAPPRGKQPRPTVGLLYSLEPFKGCDVSLKALAKVAERLPELQLVSFGTIPPDERLPLPRGAHYTMRPAQEKIRDLYAQCDVWLCGSRGEGFHLPPLEAMACRCPVVSTKVGGPLDTVRDGENGYLADVEDSDALAKRLLDVLTLDPARWRAMSDAAYQTAARYSWDDATTLLESAFEQAIQRSPRQRMAS